MECSRQIQMSSDRRLLVWNKKPKYFVINTFKRKRKKTYITANVLRE